VARKVRREPRLLAPSWLTQSRVRKALLYGAQGRSRTIAASPTNALETNSSANQPLTISVMIKSILAFARADEGTRPTIWQAASLLYLSLPLALFFLCFSSYVWGTLGACFLAWAWWRFVRSGVERSVSRPVAGALLLLACLFVAFSGILPPLWQDSDWPKHYAILQLLMKQHWPVVIDAGAGPEVLRYYLGWYLVPAGLSKLLGHRSIDFTVAAWTALGLWLVFLLLAEALKTKSQWWSVLAAFLFMFFSGLDQLGVALTGHLLGYPDHWEWWASFYQFSSIMTTLVWVPQHGLAAWIAVGLLLNASPGSRIISHAGLLFFAAFFWSPLSAVGLVPFVLLVAARGRAFRELLSVSNFLSVAALAPPVVGYLMASTGQIPHLWIFRIPTWTVQNLVCFWLLEFGVFALLVWSVGTTRPAMFAVAVAMLLLIPLYSLGAMNDFAMRASTAPLAVLAFIGIEIILTRPSRTTLPLIVAFALGIGTPCAEISRGVRWATPEGRMNRPEVRYRFDPTNGFRAQYVAPYPNRFIRSVSSIAIVDGAPAPVPIPEPVAPPRPARRKRFRHKSP
jgi:hypothetical protein